jgi:hypothetical protein
LSVIEGMAGVVTSGAADGAASSSGSRATGCIGSSGGGRICSTRSTGSSSPEMRLKTSLSVCGISMPPGSLGWTLASPEGARIGAASSLPERTPWL